MGSDETYRIVSQDQRYFNPRSPRGERPFQARGKSPGKLFQSTLPVWGATVMYGISCLSGTISIHAPRVGSDSLRRSEMLALKWISIHAPRVGSVD